MLQAHHVQLALTTTDPHQRPAPPRPEIAFVGRSNVGKSSLLNTLFRRKNLARTSKTPGKTRTLNYYEVDERCYFVDLPGYGYARVPEKERRAWGPMMDRYLAGSPDLVGVVSLVDGRHDPTVLDQRMIGGLAERGTPTLVALTKADRVRPAARVGRLEASAAALGVDADQVVWFSARTGEGRDEIFTALRGLLE